MNGICDHCCRYWQDLDWVLTRPFSSIVAIDRHINRGQGT